MDAVVFTGPTLSASDVHEVMDAICLPPAAQGDVFRAACQSPAAIGIIDGYFERVPSVWHKEILWAMSQGIHVFGSASMGALRAAELWSFGMVGVGAIFQGYRDGSIEDDDEVAVVHGLAEDGYRPGSDSMVNIRVTLHKAEAEGILAGPTRRVLEQVAKELFYARRAYPRILELATERGLPETELASFRRWLRGGAVNQKRDDALAMLRAMRDLLETHSGPKRVSYSFEETLWWRDIKRSWESPPRDPLRGDALVLAELACDPAAQARAMIAALARWLAAEGARHEGYQIDALALLRESTAFCHMKGISNPADIEHWLVRNACGREQLEQMLRSNALLVRAQGLTDGRLEYCLLDYLRWTGDYEALLARAVRRPLPR
jgi:hypothetical protein